MINLRLCWPYFLGMGLVFPGVCFAAEEILPTLQEIQVTSTRDQTLQPAKLWVPPGAKEQPTPMLVYLHSWSGDYRQNNSKWLKEAAKRKWIFLHPNFRGKNDHPDACGSALARQDILDAIDSVSEKYQVDSSRLYLAGSSGGGHMAMLMAGYHPERFSAVSAWVGISDLAAWYKFHLREGKPQRYAQMVATCCGGPPGASAKIDAEYKARSPIFHLHKTGNLPIHLYAGLHDGHTGSVPVSHTLKAFNVIAKAGGHEEVSDVEIQQLLNDAPLETPRPGDTDDSPTLGRKTYLQRKAGAARATIFEGGHEGLPIPGCAWLAMQVRPTKTSTETRRAVERSATGR